MPSYFHLDVTTLADIVPPTISINATHATPVHYFTAVAADNAGVAGVQFLSNGQPLGAELTAEPWQLQWNTAAEAAGIYQITARARDMAGLITQSNSIQISVASIAGEPPGLLSPGGPGVYQPKNNAWFRVQER